ncbi:thiamine biosynthesis lipoprotein ApbE precursor [unidentified eubacterium SCB49]|nr:thiamine biosynthesis lipoprotein ApbE precursor [unidentified eubacterium SCB49]
MKQILIVMLAFFIVSCNKTQDPKLKTYQGAAFGTTYSIQLYSDSEENLQDGLDAVFFDVNKSVSTYIEDSDISKINRGDTTVVVDAIFKEVFQLSKKVHTNSQGYFDPTVGTLRNAYGFGEADATLQLTPEKLDSLRRYVGFQKVNILDNGTVKKENPSVYLDFNAVAKGYGIDLLGNFLDSKNIDNYVVELGGEIVTKGKNLTRQQLWTAGVEALDSQVEDRTFSALVALDNEGLASSGNYRKFRIDKATGKKFVHTINPLTGKAEASDVTSATVIAPTCALADAYATTFMAMGLEESKDLLSKMPDIAAYLTYIDEENNTGIYITQNFKNKMLK